MDMLIVSYILIVMAGIGGVCIGYEYGQREVLLWRIRWIEMEHDLARLENRMPKSIDKAYKDKGE